MLPLTSTYSQDVTVSCVAAKIYKNSDTNCKLKSIVSEQFGFEITSDGIITNTKLKMFTKIA